MTFGCVVLRVHHNITIFCATLEIMTRYLNSLHEFVVWSQNYSILWNNFNNAAKYCWIKWYIGYRNEFQADYRQIIFVDIVLYISVSVLPGKYTVTFTTVTMMQFLCWQICFCAVERNVRIFLIVSPNVCVTFQLTIEFLEASGKKIKWFRSLYLPIFVSWVKGTEQLQLQLIEYW